MFGFKKGFKPIFGWNDLVSSGGNPPVNVVAPVLSGVLVVSQTLTCSQGTWTGTLPITFGYVFIRSTDGGINFTVIQSGASNTYVLQPADAGSIIRCNVIATNAFGVVGSGSNDVNILATLLDINSTSIEDAYYLDLLRGAYYGSPTIRVRRSGDNSEFNFGVTAAGVLDTAAITAFVIAGGGDQNGFIVTWFSQKIGGSNLIQSNPSLQAQIVSSGAIMTTSGVPTAFFAPNQTYSRTSSNLSINYSIYQYNQYNSTVRHGDINTPGLGPTSPINWNVVPVMGWRRDNPSLTYIQPISINTIFSKKCKVRNSTNASLNISKVTQYNNLGNLTDVLNLPFNGWIVPAFGSTEGTTAQRGLIVYSTSHDKATQDAIFDLMR